MSSTAWQYGDRSTTDPDPFAVPESTPALSFKDAPIGTVKGGTVTRIDVDVQGLEYRADGQRGGPAVWPSGDPKLSIVIGLDTDEGQRSFWVTKYAKDARFQAVKKAQEDADKRLEEGDKLWIKYTGNDGDRKLYAAKIEPGKPGGKGDPWADAPATQTQPQKDEPPF